MTQLADARKFSDLLANPPAWLDALRKQGAARFAAKGFPGNREEEWRFTNVAPIAKAHFQPAEREEGDRAADTAGQFSFGDEAAAELVFVNGYYAPHLSRRGELGHGVRVSSLAEAVGADGARVKQHLGRLAPVEANPFVALNTGQVADGAFIHVSQGAEAAGAIHLLFLALPNHQPVSSHPRVLIVVDDGAEASVVETYAGAEGGVYFANPVTEIVAGVDSRIDHCKLQQENLSAFHVAAMQVQLARGARFVSHSATLGGKLTRNDLHVAMTGEGADATLNGLVLIGGDQHADNHTLLDHAKPNCPSHELYKHVLSDRATGVFKGKILVRPDAQKTDSKQTSKTLLLSDDATMNSMPALEIYADDVKCTHGSTTGPVDEEQVFYLRSRGVGLDAARHLLTYAFAADITRRIRIEPVRRRLESYMAAQHGLPQDLRITDLGAHDEAARNL